MPAYLLVIRFICWMTFDSGVGAAICRSSGPMCRSAKIKCILVTFPLS